MLPLDTRGCVAGTHWPIHDIAIANIEWCMAYAGGVWGGVVYCAVVVHYFCNSVDIADARGQYKDVRLVHKSFEVKHLV